MGHLHSTYCWAKTNTDKGNKTNQNSGAKTKTGNGLTKPFKIRNTNNKSRPGKNALCFDNVAWHFSSERQQKSTAF